MAPYGEFLVSKEQEEYLLKCPDVYDYDETVISPDIGICISPICPVAVIESSEWEELTKGVGDYVEAMVS